MSYIRGLMVLITMLFARISKWVYFDDLMQNRCNPCASAMELHLFCTELSSCNRNVTMLFASPCNQADTFLSHIWNKGMEAKVVKSMVLSPVALTALIVMIVQLTQRPLLFGVLSFVSFVYFFLYICHQSYIWEDNWMTNLYAMLLLWCVLPLDR